MKKTDELLFKLMSKLEATESPTLDSVNQKLLVLSTARSGSSMFCDVLSQTGLIGECGEWFNPRYIHAYRRLKKLDAINFEEYSEFIMNKTIADTGIFAVNVHIGQYIPLLQAKIDLLNLGFDHIIYLKRDDKVAQAVSLAKASISDAWSSETMADNDNDIDRKLNNEIILKYYKQLMVTDNYYEENLSSFVQQEYNYESFSQLGSTNAYQEVLTALGVNDEEVVFQTKMKKQRNEEGEKLVANFRKYLFG